MEQGAFVKKKEGKLSVIVNGIEKQSARLMDLAQCVLLGNVGISTPAVKALLNAGVDVVFLSRRGRFLGRLSSGLSKNGILRAHQYRFLSDDHAALDLSKRCIHGKLENQRRLLRRYQKRRPRPSIACALVSLRHAVGEVEKIDNTESLRGVEGQAAAVYFSCWNDLITQDGIRFDKRIRRPPDPVNILLSFGYTVLGNLIHSMVDTAGLDPYLGALHTPRYGRPSLVLDLIEEFRPVIVDSSVIRAFNTKTITPSDFEIPTRLDEEDSPKYQTVDYPLDTESSPKPEMLFKRSGIKKWVGQLERRLNEASCFQPRGQTLPLRDIIRAQIYLLTDHIEGKALYVPYCSPE
jgi:CRISPR-associated protein Cas1